MDDEKEYDFSDVELPEEPWTDKDVDETVQIFMEQILKSPNDELDTIDQEIQDKERELFELKNKKRVIEIKRTPQPELLGKLVDFMDEFCNVFDLDWVYTECFFKEGILSGTFLDPKDAKNINWHNRQVLLDKYKNLVSEMKLIELDSYDSRHSDADELHWRKST